MWEFEDDRWIDNCIWNSINNDWLKIVAAEFKNIKICMTIVVIHVISAKIEAADFEMSIFIIELCHSWSVHIIIHVISAKIEAAESKMLIFVT